MSIGEPGGLLNFRVGSGWATKPNIFWSVSSKDMPAETRTALFSRNDRLVTREIVLSINPKRGLSFAGAVAYERRRFLPVH